MTTLKELAAMLDAATGSSRELDAVICEVFSLYPAGTERVMNTDGASNAWAGNAIWWEALPLTSSIDAALALVERLLPGVKWAKNFGGWFILYGVFNGNVVVLGSSQAHDVPFPIAILKALVAAMIAQEKTYD